MQSNAGMAEHTNGRRLSLRASLRPYLALWLLVAWFCITNWSGLQQSRSKQRRLSSPGKRCPQVSNSVFNRIGLTLSSRSTGPQRSRGQTLPWSTGPVRCPSLTLANSDLSNQRYSRPITAFSTFADTRFSAFSSKRPPSRPHHLPHIQQSAVPFSGP